jgi:hypothetical protein
MLGKRKTYSFVRVQLKSVSSVSQLRLLRCLSNLLRNVTWRPADIFGIARCWVAILLSYLVRGCTSRYGTSYKRCEVLTKEC